VLLFDLKYIKQSKNSGALVTSIDNVTDTSGALRMDPDASIHIQKNAAHSEDSISSSHSEKRSNSEDRFKFKFKNSSTQVHY
jgi:hypothetical protein